MDYIQNTPADAAEMLKSIGAPSVDALFEAVPESVRLKKPLDLPTPQPEIDHLRHHAYHAATKRTVAASRSVHGAHHSADIDLAALHDHDLFDDALHRRAHVARGLGRLEVQDRLIAGA